MKFAVTPLVLTPFVPFRAGLTAGLRLGVSRLQAPLRNATRRFRSLLERGVAVRRRAHMELKQKLYDFHVGESARLWRSLCLNDENRYQIGT